MRRVLAVAVVAPVIGLVVGIGAEMAAVSGEPWPFVLTVVVLPVLLVTAALTVAFADRPSLPVAVQVGSLAGCAAGVAFAVGDFLPFALGIDTRDLNNFGDSDMVWQASLVYGVILGGAAGITMGVACGAAAWGVRVALAGNHLYSQSEDRES
jgi:hypothetical protein